VIGALGVGAYAYYDTGQVASTAIALFENDIATEEKGTEAVEPTPTPSARTTKQSINQTLGAATRKIANSARKATGRKPGKPAEK
jgi:hypothetical protein